MGIFSNCWKEGVTGDGRRRRRWRLRLGDDGNLTLTKTPTLLPSGRLGRDIFGSILQQQKVPEMSKHFYKRRIRGFKRPKVEVEPVSLLILKKKRKEKNGFSLCLVSVSVCLLHPSIHPIIHPFLSLKILFLSSHSNSSVSVSVKSMS